jgi:hypothetical protein
MTVYCGKEMTGKEAILVSFKAIFRNSSVMADETQENSLSEVLMLRAKSYRWHSQSENVSGEQVQSQTVTCYQIRALALPWE